MELTYSIDIPVEQGDIIDEKSKIVTTIPSSISGNHYHDFNGSLHTVNDDITNSIIYNSMEVPDLVNIDKELFFYENRHGMKSNIFYDNWKINPILDKSEFNEWARLYRFLKYAED